MKEYDQYVLNIGDFDERIFLCENAHEELGTPQATSEEDLTDRLSNIRQHIEQTNSLAPTTPLSNRSFLSNRAAPQVPATPISSATQCVGRLQSLLLERKDEPSETLEEIFKECATNPREAIVKRIRDMGEKFCQVDFTRVQVIELFY